MPDPLPDWRDVIEALLWWKLAEAYGSKDKKRALEWYEKALTRLLHETKLRETAATTYWDVSYPLYEENKHVERLPYLNRAIELNPDYVNPYHSRGIVYYKIKQYEQALADYNRALELDPNSSAPYYNRGLVYLYLRDQERAIKEFQQRWNLKPPNINAALMIIWAKMSRERPGLETAKQLEEDALVDPEHCGAYVCRGIALG